MLARVRVRHYLRVEIEIERGAKDWGGGGSDSGWEVASGEMEGR